MVLLDRKGLLRKEELEKIKVELGNDEFVYVRQMTGQGRDKFEQSIVKLTESPGGVVSYERTMDDFRAKLAVNTVCDEEGNLILDADDFLKLSQHMSAKKLELIINVAQKLNAITEKDKEDLVKNLEGAKSADSTLGSASGLDTPIPMNSLEE